MSASNTQAATSSDMQVLSEQEIPARKQSNAATSSPGRRKKEREQAIKTEKKETTATWNSTQQHVVNVFVPYSRTLSMKKAPKKK